MIKIVKYVGNKAINCNYLNHYNKKILYWFSSSIAFVIFNLIVQYHNFHTIKDDS